MHKPRAQLKHRSLPTVQISLGIVLFEKIYGEPILSVFSVSGEDLQHRCYSTVHYERNVSQPDIEGIFENDFWFQMTEAGFWF